MRQRGGAALLPLALALLAAVPSSSGRSLAQSQDKSDRVGTADATSRSIQIQVPGAGGCEPFVYQPSRPAFNYTAYLGLEDPLPSGCTTSDIRVTKMFVNNVCIESRANNYGNESLGIVNSNCDKVQLGNTATCDQVFAQAPSSATQSGLAAGALVDTGDVCWQPRTVYFFVMNACTANVTVTIKTTFDTFNGTCSAFGGGSGISSSSGNLSEVAIAGIVIAAMAVAALLVTCAWCCCCQLRS